MRDHYAHITDTIIAQLEAGAVPWQRPWSLRATDAPRSIHGHYYRGFNALTCGCQGRSDPRWITFRQAQERGGSVRKGERGTCVILWKWFKETDKATGKPTGKQIPWMRTYTVFSVEQCDGLQLPAVAKPPASDWDPIADAERVVAQWFDGPTIEHDSGGRACYSPMHDTVTMPQRTAFRCAQGY